MTGDFGSVNLDAVRIRGRLRKPNTLMLRRVSLGEYTTVNRKRFCSLSFELHYDPLGWIRRLWNVGTIQLVEFTNDKGKKAWRQERILTTGGGRKPIDTPVPLDRRGFRPLIEKL